MIDETIMPARNVISLADARAMRQALPMRARLCCHCGARLGDGEIEDECSSAGFNAVPAALARVAE